MNNDQERVILYCKDGAARKTLMCLFGVSKELLSYYMNDKRRSEKAMRVRHYAANYLTKVYIL